MANISAIKLPNGTTYSVKDTISGYIATETDPVFSASAAAGITSTDINNWNAKVSDDKTWNGVTLNLNGGITGGSLYVPARANKTDTTAYQLSAKTEPTAQALAMYGNNAHLYSTTPSANDNSTKVATTAYVDSAVGGISVPTKTSDLTNDSGFVTTDNKVLQETVSNDASYPVLLGYQVGTTNTTSKVHKSFSNFSFNPSTGSLKANKFNGLVLNSLATGFSISGGSTSKTLTINESYTLAGACAKAVDNSISTSSSSSNLPTSAAVASFVEGKGYITSSAIPTLLSGTTSTVTPTQVKNALANNQNVEISHTDATFGSYKLYDFILSSTQDILCAPLIGQYGGNWFAFELLGNVTNDTWSTLTTLLATASDIPTKTSDLTNDSGFITSYTDEKVKATALTFDNNTYYPIFGNNTNTAEIKKYTDAFTIAGSSTYNRLTLTLGKYDTLGCLKLYRGSGDSNRSTTIVANLATDYREITLPDKTGIVALTDDIPDVSGKIDTAGTGLSKSGTTLNHSNSVIAQTTQAVYPIEIDAQGHISAYGSAVTTPTITLNGSSTTSPSFYAPTTAGTSGQVLTSNGSGAPIWETVPSGILDLFYPVGSYYETSDVTFDPNVTWGGTWVKDSAGRVTVAQDADDADFDTIGELGGAKTHTLIADQLPKIEGSFDIRPWRSGTTNGATQVNASGVFGREAGSSQTGVQTSGASATSYKTTMSFGNNQPHNNLQPYVIVNRWHRTA